jgi:hypothetical protein
MVQYPSPWCTKHKQENILECSSETHGNSGLPATVFQGTDYASLTCSMWCSTPVHRSPNTNKKTIWSVHQKHTEKADYLQQYSQELIMPLSPAQCGAAPQSTARLSPRRQALLMALLTVLTHFPRYCYCSSRWRCPRPVTPYDCHCHCRAQHHRCWHARVDSEQRSKDGSRAPKQACC